MKLICQSIIYTKSSSPICTKVCHKDWLNGICSVLHKIHGLVQRWPIQTLESNPKRHIRCTAVVDAGNDTLGIVAIKDIPLNHNSDERDRVSNRPVSIVCSTVGSGADQRKHQSSASLAFVWGIHR